MTYSMFNVTLLKTEASIQFSSSDTFALSLISSLFTPAQCPFLPCEPHSSSACSALSWPKNPNKVFCIIYCNLVLPATLLDICILKVLRQSFVDMLPVSWTLHSWENCVLWVWNPSQSFFPTLHNNRLLTMFSILDLKTLTLPCKIHFSAVYQLDSSFSNS